MSGGSTFGFFEKSEDKNYEKLYNFMSGRSMFEKIYGRGSTVQGNIKRITYCSYKNIMIYKNIKNMKNITAHMKMKKT